MLEENYSEAMALAETALKLNPIYWPADYFIGILHVIQKNHEDAVLNLRRAGKFASDIPDISLSLIRSLCSLNNFDEALNECDNLLKNNEKYAPAWEEKANIYFLRKDWKKAIEVCEAGLKRCGDRPVLWKYKGGAYDSLTKYDLSIECYDKQILCSPDDATGHYGKGSVLLKASVVEKRDQTKRAKYIKEALKCARQAVKLDEKLGPGWYIYALAHFQNGDTHNGLLLLDKAAKLGSIEAALLSQMLKANRNDK